MKSDSLVQLHLIWWIYILSDNMWYDDFIWWKYEGSAEDGVECFLLLLVLEVLAFVETENDYAHDDECYQEEETHHEHFLGWLDQDL